MVRRQRTGFVVSTWIISVGGGITVSDDGSVLVSNTVSPTQANA
jgi:hypothetical protein